MKSPISGLFRTFQDQWEPCSPDTSYSSVNIDPPFNFLVNMFMMHSVVMSIKHVLTTHPTNMRNWHQANLSLSALKCSAVARQACRTNSAKASAEKTVVVK